MSEQVELTVDGQPVSVPKGATILDACRKLRRSVTSRPCTR